MIKLSTSKIIDSILMSLCWALFIISLDILFAIMSPRSYFYLGQISTTDRIFIWASNALISFSLILIGSLSRLIIGKTLMIIIFSLLGILYLINWATFLVIGEFLGYEGLTFIKENFGQLLWMISQLSKWYLLALALILMSPILAYSLLQNIKKQINNSFNQFANLRMILSSAALVIIVTLGCLILFCYNKTSFPRVFNAIRFRSAPQMTLIFDQSIKTNPIAPPPHKQQLHVNYQEHLSWEDYKNLQTHEVPSVPIILIVIESLRDDILNDPKIMPNLYEFSQSSHHLSTYATSNVTDYVWPSIFNSQYPLRTRYHYYYPEKVNYPRINIHDILHQANYDTAIFSAQNEEWGGMKHTLNSESLDVFFSSETPGVGQYIPHQDPAFASFVKKFKAAGKIDDAVVTQAASSWMNSRKNNRFFVALNFQRSHYPYTWPNSFNPPYMSSSPDIWSYPRSSLNNMRNRYFNSLHYIDQQIGKIITLLKNSNLYDDSLIIITGDHGQAFYEHNGTCHSNDLFNETAQTATIIKNSSKLRNLVVNKTPELIDIAPTILSLLNLPKHPSFQGQSLDSSNIERPIFITIKSPIADQDAIISNNWKFIKDYRYDREYLFNLKTDPKEKYNILQTHPEDNYYLRYLLLTWRHEQLKYYSQAAIQKKYYPPQYSFK